MRSDEQLVVDAARGDATAWDGLVDRYANLVYANARAVGADRGLAEDVSQLVWMRLLNRLDTIREPAKVKGWLAVVARNTTRSELRRRRPTVQLDELFVLADDAVTAPEEAVTRGEDVASVRSALDRISERCRELLLLLFSAEMSYDEIVETTGMAIGSIGPTRRRCLDSLARQLEEGRLDA